MVLYSKSVPVPAQMARTEIYQSNPWWKAKKWSIQICNRLIRQRPDGVDTENFLKNFYNQVAVPIQESILKELSVIQNGGGYLPPRVITYSLLFLNKAYG